MYYLTDICFMCLKNNIKLQSVFIQDNDGIVFIEKIKCCYPEIINSIPDTHKLACTECLEKLRFMYDFKQTGLRNNTVVSNYLGKLQCEDKTRQKPAVVLPARKRRKKVSSTPNFPNNEVEDDGINFKMKIKYLNLNFAKGEPLNKIDHSCQPIATEKSNLETKNVEKVCPVSKTESICIKQEPQFSEDDSTISYLDKEAEDSEETISGNEDDPNFEISEEGTSKPNDYNNEKIDAILNTLKPCYVSDDSIKFCNTCQELLFKDLNNITLHLYTHMQSSNCSECSDSLNEIHKFQRHMFNHCETMVEMLDKGEHGEKFTCTLCDQQFDEFSNLKKHIYDEHIKSLKCVVCTRAFSYKPNLLRHILMIHCHVKLYKCKICPTRFVCKEGIKDHMIYKHYSGNVCICEFCQLSFKNPKTLREHISKYHEEELRPEEDTTANNYGIEKKISNFAMAEESNSGTSNSYNLQESVDSSIIPNATTATNASYCEPSATFNASDICNRCQKMFFNLINISEHLTAHTQKTRCSMCKDSAENISRLQRHMLTPCGNTNTPQHTANTTNIRNNDEITCVVCQRKFKFNMLKKHIYTHITNLTCVVCNETLSMKANLQRHLLHHCELKPLQCEVCGKNFSVKASLKYHVVSAHSTQVIACQYCQRTLKCRKSLRVHIKTMHPEFTYTCEVCKRFFLRKNELEKHAKTHSKN